MCIALPCRVVALDPGGATVGVGRSSRRVSTLFTPEVEVGDWVMVSVGAIVRRLSPDQAHQIRSLLMAATEPAGPHEGVHDARQ
jgi:hydrogenase expression/formation protein HypC